MRKNIRFVVIARRPYIKQALYRKHKREIKANAHTHTHTHTRTFVDAVCDTPGLCGGNGGLG